MTGPLAALLAAGILVPLCLRLERCPPTAAVALWLTALASRALAALCITLWVILHLPETPLYAELTHWCLHTALPVATERFGIEGHTVGDLGTAVPALLVTVSLLTAAFGLTRAAWSIRRWLTRESLGPGPDGTLIVPGPEVMLAAAGLKRPRVIVSAGALVQLEEDELAAAVDHERGHIARRHRHVLLLGALCHGVGRFIPGGRHAVRELAFHLERDADRWALARNDRLALAGAICKAADRRVPATPAASALKGSGAPERLMQLLDTPVAAARPRTVALYLLAATMVVSTVLAAALIPSSALAGIDEFHNHAAVHHCDH